ncbi:MAG: universal stress protein [Candidatus Nanopelagicales bacterium]
MTTLSGPVRRVLTFGDDGSDGADVAWLWVNNHVWPGWSARVVHAHLPEIGPPPPEDEARLHGWEPPQPRRAFQESGLDGVEYLRADGDPRLVLTHAGGDLLVIGHRGAGVWKALHIGSTAEWLLQQPPVPLVMVRSARTTRRVLLCVDGSPHARAACDTLLALPWLEGLEVVVAGVVERGHDPQPAVAESAEALAAAGAVVQGRLVRPGELDLVVNVRASLFDLMDQVRPDVVALGTRGLLGFRRLRLGSTASAVARHASCTVLLTHARTQEDPAV